MDQMAGLAGRNHGGIQPGGDLCNGEEMLKRRGEGLPSPSSKLIPRCGVSCNRQWWPLCLVLNLPSVHSLETKDVRIHTMLSLTSERAGHLDVETRFDSQSVQETEKLFCFQCEHQLGTDTSASSGEGREGSKAYSLG